MAGRLGKLTLMTIADLNWQHVEAYLKQDDRAVVPLGSTEQHAYLSLCVDNILAERIAKEAAEPLKLPVFPVLNYGITPYFSAFPGTVSLRLETYLHVLEDILASLTHQGFRRILFVNGHGGNAPAQTVATEWMARHAEVKVKVHNWWNAPQVAAKAKAIDSVASHASWLENFPWTRLEGVALPDEQKPLVDFARMNVMNPEEVRAYLEEGNFGGVFQKSDETMRELWQVGVAETREVLEGPW